jgi:hypothetical protein
MKVLKTGFLGVLFSTWIFGILRFEVAYEIFLFGIFGVQLILSFLRNCFHNFFLKNRNSQPIKVQLKNFFQHHPPHHNRIILDPSRNNLPPR